MQQQGSMSGCCSIWTKHSSSSSSSNVHLQVAAAHDGATTFSSNNNSQMMIPILQVPMSDLQAYNIQSYSRFSAAEQQQQQQQQGSRSGRQPQHTAGGGGPGGFDVDTEAAASPKPSSLGRIYHESPLSTYISHIQVC